ncbi:MAG: sulfurtransferase [Gammaproteobacteria bacterium CG11_big_fil_rev_8_21_14_0_20_46_22]|nr:MAG: sulfurtransferase [Gammaproteobacteria bacterium CG12_big_fil_rev_8_21_14_0_65_46_12]PIR10149.1 MAG: sulfurtransferase [Gammaproteobacteria bacterium CG11_big_fil_rev_8_21_14_0_20_46_22]
MTQTILNISAYQFVPIEDPAVYQAKYRARCQALGIKGTILLAKEGVNLALAGSEASLRQFMRQMKDDEAFADIDFKESWSETIPFRKVRVRVKDEIVMMRVPGVNPAERTARHLKAKELKQWLDEGRDVVMFDTRNEYELKVGTFKNAYNPHIDNFRELPEKLKMLPDELKKKKVVMFCTGGIRCEKATVAAIEAGFEDVYQIDGGIIKYFEECGGEHWDGECFVFDDRIAVKKDLTPSDKHYCLQCLETLTDDDLKSEKFVYNKSCPHCA